MSRAPPPGGHGSVGDAPEDHGHDLWREVTRSVRPLAGRSQPPPVRLHVSSTAPAPRVVLPAHPAPVPRAHAPLPDRGPEKRVRRGRIEIAAKLDLHGMTQAEAAAALRRFVVHHHEDGARCVLVVTGKGRGEAGGVLRRALPALLEGLRPTVNGYAEAHRKHGGGGAWYVFLRARA